MTIIEAAKKWKVSAKTIRGYIQNEVIPFDEIDGNVCIPEISKPHIIRKDLKKISRAKVCHHILQATDADEYIDNRAFHGLLRQVTFVEYMRQLEAAGYIVRNEIFQDYTNNLGICRTDKKEPLFGLSRSLSLPPVESPLVGEIHIAGTYVG